MAFKGKPRNEDRRLARFGDREVPKYRKGGSLEDTKAGMELESEAFTRTLKVVARSPNSI